MLPQGSSGFPFSLLLFFHTVNPFKMKKEKKVWALTLMALLFLPVVNSHAQELDSVGRLDEIVITATRSEQPVMDVPRSVSVINRSVIENSTFNSVGELLSNQPGLYVVGANQTPGTNQSIFMRGANSNQVVVLIDGTRITDPSSPNSTIDLAELSLANVERIEIIRGAHSTLYGGAAIGGAINIITRKGSSPGFHGVASAQAGVLGKGASAITGTLHLSQTFKSGFYVNGSLFRQDVRGLNATDDTIRTAGVYKTADSDDFQKMDAGIKAGYNSGSFDTYISYRDIDQHALIDDRAFDDDDNAFLDFQRKLVDYKAGYRINDLWSLTFNGSWSKSERNSVNDSSIVNTNGDYDKTYLRGNYFGKILTNEVVLRYAKERFSGIVGGGQYRERMYFNTYYFSNAFGFPFESEVDYDSINISTRTSYVFTQLNYEAGNFALTAGSRLSRHSLFGSQWTFEASPSYRFDDLVLYGSVSSGFNAPSLYQLFDPSRGFGAYTTRGNSELEAEKSLSWELGLKKEFVNGNYLTLSAFRSLTSDAIEYVYLWKRGKPVAELGYADYAGDTYLNVSTQQVQGIEATGFAKFGKFFLNGNISYIKSEIEYNSNDLDAALIRDNYVQLYNYGSFASSETSSSNLARRPQVTGYAEAGFRPDNKWTLTLQLRHAGSRYDVNYDADLGPFGALGQTEVNTYNLVDAGVAWQLNKRMLLSARVENVFDEQYREINGFQTRGRSAHLKAVFKW